VCLPAQLNSCNEERSVFNRGGKSKIKQMKALIPAAGLGTRWYPWSKIVPKELLPLGRYPAIHYVLEEAVAAGIREIGIIISKAKQLIRSLAHV
jgi:UTP-glucose-1-phosphate uridylyltransferase